MSRWVAIFALAFLACGGALLENAQREFNAGQYADAKRTLDGMSDADYRASDARTRTRYALYRGLVMGALGDRSEARSWLGLAKGTEEQFPGSLTEDDRARLKLAEDQYGPLPITAAPPPAP